MVKKSPAQSFVEFALILPVLLIILLGVVELTLFIGTYINLLDLTREAARFASNRDPFSVVQATTADRVCAPVSPSKKFDFFYDSSCIFSPLAGTSTCVDAAFCDGFNSTIQIKPEEDDILIYAYTEYQNKTTNQPPQITYNEKCNASDTGGCPWVWSNNKTFATTSTNNWQRNCNRMTPAELAQLKIDHPEQVRVPSFSPAILQSYLSSGAQTDKGFVVVEVVFCYHMVLDIPILSIFLPDPMVIDTYSIMPLPAAQPTLVP